MSVQLRNCKRELSSRFISFDEIFTKLNEISCYTQSNEAE